MPRTPTCSEAEHGRARIDTDDCTIRTDCINQFTDEEARAASNVQDAITRFGSDGLTDQTPTSECVTRVIHAFEPLRYLLVKRPLAHVSLPASGSTNPERIMPALERVLLSQRASTRLVDVDLEEWRRQLRVATYGVDGPAIVSALSGELPLECLQAAGAALVVALGREAPGAFEIAERCCAALRARGSTGDGELVGELEVAMGRATDGLTPAPADLEELAMVLGEAFGADAGVLDLETGEAWSAAVIENSRDAGIEELPGEPDGKRWLAVWPARPDDAYRDMSDFIATVADPATADRLSIAIDGKGAFRRFRDLLGRWPAEATRWHAFSDDRQIGRARAWLADAGYRSVSRTATPG